MKRNRTKHLPLLAYVITLVVVSQRSLVAEQPNTADVPQASKQPTRFANLEQVIVVFKTHFDIGYTAMAGEVVERYRTSMIDNALQVIQQSNDLLPEHQFKWTIPGWPMSKILEDWPGQTAQRKQTLEAAFRQGRLVLHALPFTTHTESLELEDLVRGLGYSARLSRAAGLPLPRAAKMTDVPSHSWVLPTLLKHAGVDFLHLGCNPASRSPHVPMLFWWEGPDGSRLLTVYSSVSYGTGIVPPSRWPHKTWLAMVMSGDNHGPPTTQEVQRLLEEAKQQLPPHVKLKFGRLEDFSNAIVAEDADLPIIRGDMPDTWIHGPMSDPAGWQAARNIRPQIAAAETLNTHLRLWGVSVSDGHSTIAAAYEQSLLYGEHTWGGALRWMGGTIPYGQAWHDARQRGRFNSSEASWEEHTDYIRRTRALIEPELSNNLDALAGAVGVEGRRIVVYNALPWQRDGLVTLPAAAMGPIDAVKAVDDEETVAVDNREGKVSFLARRVPAMGYRTYVPASGLASSTRLAADERAATLESRFFKAVLDPVRGTVTSLIDKRAKRELVDTKAAHGFGQYLYERFDLDQVDAFAKAYVKIDAEWALTELAKPGLAPATDVAYEAVSPHDFEMKMVHGSHTVSAVLSAPAGGGIPQPITTTVTLYADQPYVDVAVTIHDKPLEPWPEAGWICVPLNVDAPTFGLGRLGGTVDPASDIVPATNAHYLCLSSGMTVTDSQGSGVGLCPLDSPCVSLEKPGLWQYSRAFVPTRPRVYVNLFNNQWSTNFRFWNGGTWTSRVRLWSIHKVDGTARNLVTPSWQARSALLCGVADGPAGSLPARQTGLAVSRKGVLVTAFGRNPDGPGTVLRLWEQAGETGPCTVRLPKRWQVDSVQPVDLRGQELGDPIPVRDGSFSVTVQTFAPSSLTIR